MRNITSIVSLLLLLGIATLAPAQLMLTKAGLSHPSAWQIERGTKLTINGKSNVAGIACGNADYNRCDTLFIDKFMDGAGVQLKGALAMELIDFNCHNFLFTSHLRKILRVNEYPYMTIRFLKLDKIPVADRNCDACGIVEISLAGVTRCFEVPIKFVNQPGGKAVLVGTRKFKLQDFDLKPPPKVPFVKVENDFVVEFNMSLTRVQ